MNIVIIGYGRTGIRISDEISRHDRAEHNAINEIYAVDTDNCTINSVTHIDKENTILYGEDPYNGTDKNRETGVDIAPLHLQDTFDNIVESIENHPDIIITIGALSGGTGGPGQEAFIDAAIDKFSSALVTSVSVLPSIEEPTQHIENALRSVQNIANLSDNTILVDPTQLGYAPPQYTSASPNDQSFDHIATEIADAVRTIVTAPTDKAASTERLEDSTISNTALYDIMDSGSLSAITKVSWPLPRAAKSGIFGTLAEIKLYLISRLKPIGSAQLEQKNYTPLHEHLSEINISLNTDTIPITDNEHNSEGTVISLKDLPAPPEPPKTGSPQLRQNWITPTQLLPIAQSPSAASIKYESTKQKRCLTILKAPRHLLSSYQTEVTHEWTKKTSTAVSMQEGIIESRSPNISVIQLNTDIGIPEQIADLNEKLKSSPRNQSRGRDQNVFE